MMDVTRRVIGAALLLSACGLSACARSETAIAPVSAEEVRARLTGDEAGRAALAQLYEEAVAAGEAGPTVYIASVPEEFKPLTDAFAAAFPSLRASYQRYIGERLAARLDGEFASGNHVGDVLLVSASELRSQRDLGRLAAFEPVNLALLDQQYRDSQGYFYAVYKKTFAIAYNTNLVRPEEAPQTIADVLNPRWRGRYTFPSGNATTVTGNGPLSLLYEEGLVTDAQIKALFEHGVNGPPSSELLPTVSQGRYAFALWVNTAATHAQASQGAPLAFYFPRELSIHVNVAAAIVRDARNPISSRLFVAWLLTPQAQQILADLQYYGTAEGAPAPEGYPPLDAFINAGVPEDEAWTERLLAFHRHRLSIAN